MATPGDGASVSSPDKNQKQLRSVLQTELAEIDKEADLINLNKEMVVDLHSRVMEMEKVIARQQATIDALVRLKSNNDIGDTPSIGGLTFSTSKSTNRRYTAEEHKAMHEFLQSKLSSAD